MKDIILKKGGIGLIVVLLLSLIAGVYFTHTAKGLIAQAIPVVQNEVADFLPITIKGGEIVEPKDTVISKDYENGKGKLVLDTRVNEFEPSALTKTGLYISKKYIYTYNGNKIEIHSMDKFPDMVIDQETVSTAAQAVEKYSGKIIFFVFFIGVALAIGIVVLLTTILIHWLMALIFHVTFSHTLRINTLAYSTLYALSMFAGISFSLLINFVILIAANVAINTMDKS